MRLIREIDGHKFYTVSYVNKVVASAYARPGFLPVLENGRWYNYMTVLGYQEDIHEQPFVAKA